MAGAPPPKREAWAVERGPLCVSSAPRLTPHAKDSRLPVRWDGLAIRPTVCYPQTRDRQSTIKGDVGRIPRQSASTLLVPPGNR
jgi:hypothetical protein